MKQLYPEAKKQQDLRPKFGAGQYGTEISALLSRPATITHSSLWGGDLQAFILQAAPRGVMKRSQLLLSAGDHVLPGLGDKMPDGVILGARGAYGLMSPDTPLNRWWFSLYEKAYNVYPVQAPYRMAQALLGLKLAVEKAMAANGGKKPTGEQLAAALKGLEWESPAGTIRMVNGNGHQAIQDTAIGRTKYDAEKKRVDLVDIVRFKAECVNPPPDMKSESWINSGFKGATMLTCRAMLALIILVDGIVYASWLFIVALGLTLVFGVLKILNIAHGSFYARRRLCGRVRRRLAGDARARAGAVAGGDAAGRGRGGGSARAADRAWRAALLLRSRRGTAGPGHLRALPDPGGRHQARSGARRPSTSPSRTCCSAPSSWAR